MNSPKLRDVRSITVVMLLFFNSIHAQSSTKEILILGTFHFSNKLTDSITSKEKQKELHEILNSLEKFNPDQILVERPSNSDSLFLEAYRTYKKEGTLPSSLNWLINNEIYQIGIKLASRLNLSNGVQGIDWRLPDLHQDSIKFENDFEKYFYLYSKDLIDRYNTKNNSIDSAYIKKVASTNSKLRKYYGVSKNISLKRAYQVLNTENIIEELYFSNRLALLYTNTTIGAELTEISTLRDYKSFRNALNTIDPKSKRILIIYGAGHTYILKKLFKLSGEFDVKNLNNYMK